MIICVKPKNLKTHIAENVKVKNLMHIPHYIKHEKMSENYQTNKISRATSAFPNKRDVLLKSGKFNLLEKEMPEKNNMNTTTTNHIKKQKH